MSLTQHFQGADIKTLPEAMKECKKGCDADATCRYATLFSASWGPKTCEFYGTGCENNIMELIGSHLYMKQGSETITRRKRQNQVEGRYYRIYNISTTHRLKFRIQAKYIYKTKFQNFRNASYRIKSHRANRIFWKNVVKR